MSRNAITIITRIKTVNIGNEALSTELIKTVSRMNPKYVIRAIERAPMHLASISYSKVKKPVDEFSYGVIDGWAKNLSSIKAREAQNHANEVELIFRKSEPKKISAIRSHLNLRGYLASLGFYKRDFGSRIGNFSESALVLLNPAGELNPKSIDPPLRMFSELLAAKKCGARVGLVNFSFEIDDPDVIKLFVSIFNHIDFIYVRDSLSFGLLEKSGVDLRIMKLVPDLAFMTTINSGDEQAKQICLRYGVDKNSAVIVINGKTGLSAVSDWVEIVNELRGRGFKPIVMSNELSSDIGFARELQALTNIDVLNEQFSYQTYSTLLGNSGLVVSNRLHTCILALVAGALVVPVEPIMRKIRGLFADMNYPISVPSVREEGWVGEVIENIDKILEQKSEIKSQMDIEISKIRQIICEAYQFNDIPVSDALPSGSAKT